MLIKISNDQYLDINEIYLVDYDEYNRELMIFIKTHPKIPVVLKDKMDIEIFKDNLEFLMRRPLEEKYEKPPRTPEDVSQTSDGSLEQPGFRAESTIQ